MIKIIIWDWNGTLLNDVKANLKIINKLLKDRGLKKINLVRYRKLFKMPIVEFYKDLGFNFEKESFGKIAIEYFGLYKNKFANMPLSDGVIEVLNEIRERGYKQYIISAMNEVDLVEQVKSKGIAEFFENIVGVDNIHGISKKQRAIDFISTIPKSPKMIFIGDMDHDFEVASAIGARCILYRNGHQQIKESEQYWIIDNLIDILKFI